MNLNHDIIRQSHQEVIHTGKDNNISVAVRGSRTSIKAHDFLPEGTEVRHLYEHTSVDNLTS